MVCKWVSGEKTSLSYEASNTWFQKRGRIVTREMLGSETLYKVDLGIASVMVKSFDESFRADDNVVISVRKEDICFFDQDGNRLRGTVVDEIVERLHAGSDL